ncbi:hypothetical protein acdb102_21600 [Acidothermaceae bacterium B102]|nr:hypothetical protein acdb102_21600 [Acidothermaceae bacterium B102]
MTTAIDDVDNAPSVRRARDLLVQLAATSRLTSDPSAAAPEQFVPHYPSARAWVTHHYSVMYVRRLRNGQRWCARWFEHPEAAMRFEALWRTWEQARLTEFIGTALWLRAELDHHLPILHSDDGPFAGCVDGEHRLPTPALYPVADVPAADVSPPATTSQ